MATLVVSLRLTLREPSTRGLLKRPFPCRARRRTVPWHGPDEQAMGMATARPEALRESPSFATSERVGRRWPVPEALGHHDSDHDASHEPVELEPQVPCSHQAHQAHHQAVSVAPAHHAAQAWEDTSGAGAADSAVIESPSAWAPGTSAREATSTPITVRSPVSRTPRIRGARPFPGKLTPGTPMARTMRERDPAPPQREGVPEVTVRGIKGEYEWSVRSRMVLTSFTARRCPCIEANV